MLHHQRGAAPAENNMAIILLFIVIAVLPVLSMFSMGYYSNDTQWLISDATTLLTNLLLGVACFNLIDNCYIGGRPHVKNR